MLEKKLGNKMQAKDVAEYTGLDVKTVRKYYKELGGMRLGRLYVFFERRLIDAISKRTEVESPSAEKWETDRKNIQHEEGSQGVGSRDAEKARKRLAREDRHGLFG